ncbi:HU family DNA-binding protein [Thalassobius sp. Cn5-15]|uniref:HU family DNA-binding protein n=1 Tax=Thalassobius sp. Cn5-15 TaxID=2917763 RepID=UPI001EF371F6|nr:HU family DNA-binding protein [Thalassobius sp. Cn5-15]MCG7492007.1 HU family DNA-binding protein [Thalassobius sp. Cn5-15]
MARSTTTKTTTRKTAAKPASTPAKTAAKSTTKSTTKATAKVPLPRTRKKATPATAAADAPEAVVVTETKPVSSQEEMKKPELIDMIVEKTGVKKRDVKPAIEAALDILGEALAEGRELNLQPFGKVRINRLKELSGARVMNLKVRQKIKIEEDVKDPLAEPAE